MHSVSPEMFEDDTQFYNYDQYISSTNFKPEPLRQKMDVNEHIKGKQWGERGDLNQSVFF